jgi:hypothetical protein
MEALRLLSELAEVEDTAEAVEVAQQPLPLGIVALPLHPQSPLRSRSTTAPLSSPWSVTHDELTLETGRVKSRVRQLEEEVEAQKKSEKEMTMAM